MGKLIILLLFMTQFSYAQRECPFFLGRGEYAEVHRVQSARGNLFAQKNYFPESGNQAYNDFISLRFLRMHQKHLPIEIVRVFLRKEKSFHADYVPGLNLNEILKSDGMSDELKNKLKIQYYDVIQKFISFFKEQGFEFQVRTDTLGFGNSPLAIPYSLYAVRDSDRQFIEFLIKVDNIVVDLRTLKMTLVDPY